MCAPLASKRAQSSLVVPSSPMVLMRRSRRRQADRTRGKQVEVQLLCYIGDHLLRLHAVACFIERRRENRDGSFARNNRQDSAANSAFCWEADMPGPTARSVIQAS